MLKYLIFFVGCFISTVGSATCTGLGCTCTIAATGIAFGAFNPLSNNSLDGAGSLSVTCSAFLNLAVNIAYQITLSAGSSANFNSRQMSSGANHLNYNLYTNLAHTTIWGDGSGSTSTISDSYIANILTPRVTNYPVYGRIPAATTVAPGMYSDALIATVIF